MSTPKFARCDTRKADGCYVQFDMVVLHDEHADGPEERDEGFWPSSDPHAAGYIGPDGNLAEAYAMAKARLQAFECGDWNYVGVRAVARCCIVQNGVGIYVNVESPGVWGIESDSDEKYLRDTWREEIEVVKGMLIALGNPIFE